MHCSRSFNPESLERHQRVCQVGKAKPKKAYNARQKRLKALAEQNGLSQSGIKQYAQKVRQQEVGGGCYVQQSWVQSC